VKTLAMVYAATHESLKAVASVMLMASSEVRAAVDDLRQLEAFEFRLIVLAQLEAARTFNVEQSAAALREIIDSIEELKRESAGDDENGDASRARCSAIYCGHRNSNDRRHARTIEQKPGSYG
jgi:hypothetical protein